MDLLEIMNKSDYDILKIFNPHVPISPKNRSVFLLLAKLHKLNVSALSDAALASAVREAENLADRREYTTIQNDLEERGIYSNRIVMEKFQAQKVNNIKKFLEEEMKKNRWKPDTKTIKKPTSTTNTRAYRRQNIANPQPTNAGGIRAAIAADAATPAAAKSQVSPPSNLAPLSQQILIEKAAGAPAYGITRKPQPPLQQSNTINAIQFTQAPLSTRRLSTIPEDTSNGSQIGATEGIGGVPPIQTMSAGAAGTGLTSIPVPRQGSTPPAIEPISLRSPPQPSPRTIPPAQIQSLLSSIPSGDMYNNIRQMFVAEINRIYTEFVALDPTHQIFLLSHDGKVLLYNSIQDMRNRVRASPENMIPEQFIQQIDNLSEYSLGAVAMESTHVTNMEETPEYVRRFNFLREVRADVLAIDDMVKQLNLRLEQLKNQMDSVMRQSQQAPVAQTRPVRGYAPRQTIREVPTGETTAVIAPPRRTVFQRLRNYFTRRRPQVGGKHSGRKHKRGTRKHSTR